jgi:hypothetical protein
MWCNTATCKKACAMHEYYSSKLLSVVKEQSAKQIAFATAQYATTCTPHLSICSMYATPPTKHP